MTPKRLRPLGAALCLLLVANTLAFASAQSPAAPVMQEGPLFLDTRCDNDSCTHVQIDNDPVAHPEEDCAQETNILDTDSTGTPTSPACHQLYWGNVLVSRTVGTGLSGAGNAVSLDATDIASCTTGTSKIVWSGATNRLACGTDKDTTYGVATGSGLTLSGTTLGTDPAALQKRVTGTCLAAPNAYVREVKQDGTVTCGQDANSGGTVTSLAAGAGLLASTDPNPITSSGALSVRLSTSGGLSKTLGGAANELGLLLCADGKILKRVASAWACADDVGAGWADDGTTVRLLEPLDNVGIGTTNPQAKLHVAGDGAQVRAQNAAGTFGAFLEHRSSDDAAVVGGLSSSPLALRTNGADRMTIDAAGNVGIGTMPAHPLDVAGNIRFSGTLQGGTIPWGSLEQYPPACDAGEFVTGLADNALACAAPSLGGGWMDDGPTVRLLESGDNVGIGIAAPSSKLHVAGTLTVSDGELDCLGCVADDEVKDDISISHSLLHAPKNGGNVGIGTTAPDERLTVHGTAASAALRAAIFNNAPAATANQAGVALQVKSDAGHRTAAHLVASLPTLADASRVGLLEFGVADQGVFSTRMAVRGSSVGIGTTSPETLLEIEKGQAAPTTLRVSNPDNLDGARAMLDLHQAGDFSSQAFSIRKYPSASSEKSDALQDLKDGTLFLHAAKAGNFFFDPGDGGNVVFNDGNTENARISSNGNLGVGTASPVRRLDVDGTAMANEFEVDAGRTTPHSGPESSVYVYRTSNAGGSFPFNGHGNLVLQSSPSNGGSVVLVAGTTNTLVATPEGRVGIGTPTPDERLTVAGIVKASGFAFPDGSTQTSASGGISKLGFAGTSPAGYAAAFDGDAGTVTPAITGASGGSPNFVDFTLSLPAFLDYIKIKYSFAAAGGSGDKAIIRTVHENGETVVWGEDRNSGTGRVLELWGPGVRDNVGSSQFITNQPHSKVTKIQVGSQACCMGSTATTIFELEAFKLGGSVIS